MYGRKIIGAWEWGLLSWEVGFYSNTEGHASMDGRRTIPLQLSYGNTAQYGRTLGGAFSASCILQIP